MMLALLLLALLATTSTPPPIMAERRADHFASLAMLAPAVPSYEVTSKTRFFVDNQEVTQKQFMDRAGLITELIVEGVKVLTIKAKAK